MNEVAVEITGLRKQFPSVLAVNDIDLTVERGEILAFLGPNGAGKTTTLDMVLGLSHPTSGSIRVCGTTPREAIKAGKVSALLQTGGLIADITVGETVDYIASTFPKPTMGRRALELAGITDLANRKVKACSGGEQQRLKFALALLPDPEVLILDEPTAGMDVTARRSFWNRMQAEATVGRTVIFATHYLEEAEQFARRVVFISEGSIVADGPTDQIRDLTGAREVRACANNPEAVMTALRERFPSQRVEINGSSVATVSTESDNVARFLLAMDGVSALEISHPSLEDSFVRLTKDRKVS
ncbi:ABC transporter ATP-binding protein [Dermabacter sp.]|uniref:ABC transporter ATP-binding protein n=1 Tax=Dermabacter sp. TaxID=37640 RepID=UPI002901C63F|nr:ABC transporter ATP-binding protein [Dermabacter sp.]MDU1464279.1 ABC transporter ATP-binding protein [Dermabacter sp.]